MSKFAKASQIENEPTVKLFEGERALVIIGIFGFILSAGIAIYMFFRSSIILPEGNVKDAFSFNAAIGTYILSIAAILPLTRFNTARRKVVRGLFIFTSLYSYTIETVQNFRGISPRFSREGTVVDMAAGILFGVVSLVLVGLAVVLTVHFFRLKKPSQRPLLIMGIRYAFISVLTANIAGLWMILLQDRLTGVTGNIIVLHGIGFHALQTLILPAWLLEKAVINERFKRRLIHAGCIAWLLMIFMIGIQTALGESVFELTPLPIIACLFFLIWFGTVVVACMLSIKKRKELTVTAKVLE
ncbi:hypothetical protein [Neobacillus niacini]|uniref:hypothetical protein n=1 Tax=Neobacillus niacini TaxID=86668 RepID=UPI001C8D253B|nr:hypothetical protein [Neobacillus niacini]MBY0148756.1 hypothetical protein [Neobacillus niacini]